MKTFPQARREILLYLKSSGWQVSDLNLKIPHATSPDGEFRLWFKPQAVHYTEGNRHSFGDARAMYYDFDIRMFNGPSFLTEIERVRQR